VYINCDRCVLITIRDNWSMICTNEVVTHESKHLYIKYAVLILFILSLLGCIEHFIYMWQCKSESRAIRNPPRANRNSSLSWEKPVFRFTLVLIQCISEFGFLLGQFKISRFELGRFRMKTAQKIFFTTITVNL
jgi:hypothetical protein